MLGWRQLPNANPCTGERVWNFDNRLTRYVFNVEELGLPLETTYLPQVNGNFSYVLKWWSDMAACAVVRHGD